MKSASKEMPVSEIERHVEPPGLERSAALTLRHESGGAGVLKYGALSKMGVCRPLRVKGEKLYPEKPGQTE